MRHSIQYIREKLGGRYPLTEIEGFVALIFDQVCGFSRTELVVNRNIEIQPDQKQTIYSIIDRLLDNEPIQYILGEAHFYGLKFNVSPSVLIPRGETEELVDRISAQNQIPNPLVLDVGTGSGCIAIALKKNLPEAQVWACDISDKALELANFNALKNKTNITFFQFDVLNPQQKIKLSSFDIIVSNPPYITQKEKSEMPANVLNFEPELALFVPDHDPLLFYRQIGEMAIDLLNEGGKLYFEINEAYGTEVVEIIKRQGFQDVLLIKDLHGKDRMVEAIKREKL